VPRGRRSAPYGIPGDQFWLSGWERPHPPGLEDCLSAQTRGASNLRLVRSPDSPCSKAQFEMSLGHPRRSLGGAVISSGEEPLEAVVGRILAERGLKVAVAESLTGGAVGAASPAVPGAAATF